MGKGAKKRKLIVDGIEVYEGTGNVFADLGYPNPEEALAKARLADHISGLIEDKGLTQVKAAVLLGVDQPKISKIRKGQVREFSVERLLRFVSALGEDVEVVISSREKAGKQKTLRVPLFGRKRKKLHGTKAA
jgi:predicted XRE-type DNA-binding protein